jgi:hypothetical protein
MTLRRLLEWQFVLLIGLFGILWASLSQADGNKPAMLITSPRHDAGTHREGETVSHTFEVKNNGTEELRILNVKPG